MSKSETRLMEALVSGPTLRQMCEMDPNAARDQFKGVVARILLISGIKDPPDEILMGFLWAYAQNYLRGFTIDDLQLAFLMNAAGELPQRVEHYGLCDINYISRVMNIYTEMKRTTVLRAKTLIAPAKEPDPPTGEESYAGLIEYCRKHGAVPEYWAWQAVFQHMDECLMIEEGMEERRALFDRVYAGLAEQLEAESQSLNLSSAQRADRQAAMKEQAKNICRRQMVCKYLKWQE